MEVVLANGQIINASHISNPDLFAALKGGSNNFGVVTRFDLMSFPQKSFWGGAILYPESAQLHQLQAFADFMDSANLDPFAAIEQSFLYYGTLNAFQSTNNMFYTKPMVNPPALQGFATIQPQLANSMRLSSMTNFTQELESAQPVNQQFENLTPANFRWTKKMTHGAGPSTPQQHSAPRACFSPVYSSFGAPPSCQYRRLKVWSPCSLSREYRSLLLAIVWD